MNDLLARLGELALAIAGRLIAVVVLFVVLVVTYAIVMALVRRVARRAAAALMPGEGGLPAQERAVREATRRRRLDTIVVFVSRLGQATIAILGALSAIAILAPEILAALGALGVALGVAVGGAVGFGAQQLVRDYLNGILILGENPFSIGDVVSIAGVSGTVEEVGLRRTVVRDVDGVVHSVPNGAILVASNMTRTFARVNERVLVAAGTDLTRATAILADACAELGDDVAFRDRFVEPPTVVRVDAPIAGESGIPIRLSATVRPGEQWELAGELRRRAIEALRAGGIDLAAGRTYLVQGGPPRDADSASEAEDGADFT